MVSWAIKEAGDITHKRNNSKPIVEIIKYLKEVYSFSEKDHSDHDSKEYPVDISPVNKHTHCMSDEGEFVEVILKNCR